MDHIECSCCLIVCQSFSCMSVLHLLSSSLIRFSVKVGLFNAKIQNENDRYNRRLIISLMNKTYFVIQYRIYLQSWWYHCLTEVWSGQFWHLSSRKTNGYYFDLLRTSYHVQRYMYHYHSTHPLIMQSFQSCEPSSKCVILKKQNGLPV